MWICDDDDLSRTNVYFSFYISYVNLKEKKNISALRKVSYNLAVHYRKNLAQHQL